MLVAGAASQVAEQCACRASGEHSGDARHLCGNHWRLRSSRHLARDQERSSMVSSSLHAGTPEATLGRKHNILHSTYVCCTREDSRQERLVEFCIVCYTNNCCRLPGNWKRIVSICTLLWPRGQMPIRQWFVWLCSVFAVMSHALQSSLSTTMYALTSWVKAGDSFAAP